MYRVVISSWRWLYTTLPMKKQACISARSMVLTASKLLRLRPPVSGKIASQYRLCHLTLRSFCQSIRQGSRRPRGGQWFPAPPLEIGVPPFHVWPTGCGIHPTLHFKNVAPPFGFWPLLLFFGPPAVKSWRRAWAYCALHHIPKLI